jgi:anti-sigma factor RsiW
MQTERRLARRTTTGRPVWIRSLQLAAATACALLATWGYAGAADSGRTWAPGRMYLKLRASGGPPRRAPSCAKSSAPPSTSAGR